MEDVTVKIPKEMAEFIQKQEWFKERFTDFEDFVLSAARKETERIFNEDPRYTVAMIIDVPAPIVNYLHSYVALHGGNVKNNLVAFVCDGLQAYFSTVDRDEREAIMKKFNLPKTMLGFE